MTYATQRDAISRTRQDLVVLGVRECQNHYANDWMTGGHAIQWMLFTEDFSQGVWVKTSTTVTANVAEAPNGTMTADEIIFNAANDAVHQTSSGAGSAVTSKAFTGSIWMKIPSGTETITLRVTNAAETQAGDVQVTLTTTWQRFFMHKLFTGVPVDSARLKIIRLGGDTVTTLHAWGGNLHRTPGDQDRVIKFPYISREIEEGIQNRVSRCFVSDAGDGARCFYSRATCQDPEHFNAGNAYEAEPRLMGIREYRVCRKDAALPPLGEDVYPYLVGIPAASQKIEPERAVTMNERITFSFEDDASPGVWNLRQQAEGALVNTQSGAGTFWRRWSAIYRGFSNPECYVIRKSGFLEAGMTEATFQNRGKYLMKRLQFDDRNIKLVCTDRLKLTRKEMPGTISDTNVLRFPILAAVTALEITDMSEIPTPAANADTATPDYIITLEIEPDTANAEKVNVLGFDTSVPTFPFVDIQRGRWGTIARNHPAGSHFRLVYEFGTERGDPTGVPMGINIIDAILQMYRYTGLREDEIDTATFQSERDAWLLTVIDGATGASYGPAVRRTITENTEVETLASELRELSGLMVFVSAGLQISCRLFAPILPGATVATLTDAANIVSGSVTLEEDDEDRVSRVLIGYDLIDGEAGDSTDDFNRVLVEADLDAESRNYYGEQRQKVLLTKWLQNVSGVAALDLAAANFTAQISARFRHGRRILKAALNIKDDDIDIGDPLQVQTAHIQDAHGNSYDGKMFVMSKRTDGERITIEVLDTFNVLERPWFYQDTGVADYDAATATERERAFLSDTFGMVGTGTNRTSGYKATI